MADLTDIESSLPIKITGTTLAGTETNPVNADSTGSLYTVNNNGTGASAVNIQDGGNVISVDDAGGSLTVDQATASNLNAQVVGNVANNASDSGNPVKIGGVYRTTPSTLSDGQRGDVLLDVNGKPIVKAQVQDNLGNGINSTNYGSSQRNLNVQIGAGQQVDSYSRVRVVTPQVLFGIYFSNSTHPLLLNTSTTGSGTTSFQANNAALRLSTTTASGDQVIVQTKRYLRYNPGISYFLGVSGVIGANKTNVRKRFGYFDANDGFFFEQTGTDFAIVTRTSTSGSPVDTRVVQSSWNLDKLDGTGPSGVTLDTTKHNLFVADFVWQGAGPIRFGVMLGRTIVYIHEVQNGNVNSFPYLRSPSKPGRIEITNTGAVATSTNMDISCLSAEKEGIEDDFASETFTKSNGVTNKTANSTTPLPVLSIRPKATFNGITNRVPLLLNSFELFAVQDSVYVQVLYNPTLTGASFTSVNTNSAAEYDTSATAVSGGSILFEGYVPGGGKGADNFVNTLQEIVLGLDIAGSVQDIITVTAAKLNGNSDVYAALTWEEYQ